MKIITGRNVEKKKIYKNRDIEFSEIIEQIKILIENEPNKLPNKKLEKLNQLDGKLDEILSKINNSLTKYNTKYARIALEIESFDKKNSALKEKILE